MSWTADWRNTLPESETARPMVVFGDFQTSGLHSIHSIGVISNNELAAAVEMEKPLQQVKQQNL